MAILNNPEPVVQANRIKTIDIIRGAAVLGILLMNIIGFGFNMDNLLGVMQGPRTTRDFYTMTTILSFFDGSMRGIFSMLFGAGMILFTLGKKEQPGGATIVELYYRRLLWLLLFGLFNAFVLLWDGDILYLYALCGMVLFVFRKTRIRWLFVLALACMCVLMVKKQNKWSATKDTRVAYLAALKAEKDSVKLTDEQEMAKAEWPQMEQEGKQPLDPVFASQNRQKMRSGYGSVFTHLQQRIAYLQTVDVYETYFWDALIMMFLGMALLRLGFFSNHLSTSTYLLWLLAGYGIGIPLGYFLLKNGFLLQFTDFVGYVDRYRVIPDLAYDVRRALIAVGHVSLLMLVYRSGIAAWFMQALANVGQMAFTNYLMQSILCTFLFFGYGFGWYDTLKLHQLYYVVGCIWLLQLIYSSIWLKYFRFGPFEWLWRSLTYWKMQPMRK